MNLRSDSNVRDHILYGIIGLVHEKRTFWVRWMDSHTGVFWEVGAYMAICFQPVGAGGSIRQIWQEKGMISC